MGKWSVIPDITLLAPLARVLKTDVDTLLSFHEELTEKEINQLVKEVSDCMQKDSYAVGFEKGEALLKAYQNCDMLRLYIAEILNVFLSIKKIENKEKYENKIMSWYELALESKEKKIVSLATASVVIYYMNKGNYEKAQQMLGKVQPIG